MIRVKIIMLAVCQYYEITSAELFKKARSQEVAERRQMFYYLCRKYTKISSYDIGQFSKLYSSNSWDHATVLYSTRIIKDLISVDATAKRVADKIERILQALDNENELKIPEIKESIIRLVLDSSNVSEIKKNVYKYVINL